MSKLTDHANANDAARGSRKERDALDKRLPIGAELTGADGFITVETDKVHNDETWDWILDHHRSVTAATHEIDETYPVEIGAYQGYMKDDKTGEMVTTDLFRYKARVRARRPGQRLATERVAELGKLVAKRKKVEPKPATGPWMLLCLADLQLGKGEGTGTPGTIERVSKSIDAFAAMAKATKPAGIAIVDMGDLTEGTSCFYDGMPYKIDLNLTEQISLAIDVCLSAIDACIALAPRVMFGVVPSNHGEFRTAKGTTQTDAARDNADIVIADSIAKIMKVNPDRYGHVEVWAPPLQHGDPFVLTYDMDGVLVGFTHGHQVRVAGLGRMAKLEKWWGDHRWSDRARREDEVLPTVADVDILVTGHGHTLMVSQQTGKLLVQCPAADPGSEWFTTSSGKRSSAGVLTFQISDRWPMLANSFEIL